jgi:hypothetical protein
MLRCGRPRRTYSTHDRSLTTPKLVDVPLPSPTVTSDTPIRDAPAPLEKGQ